jgi:mRNA guanylyltransferase
MIRLANKEDGVEAIKITDENLISILKNVILSNWENNKHDFFPAPQPVSLDRKSMTKLVENEYLVCAKSDGMRFLMINYEHNTYMSDRAFKFSKIEQNFNDQILYKDPNTNCGFIIDGELVKFKNSNQWQYVVHDCITMAGVSVFNQTFPKRYECVKTLVNKIWIPDKSSFKISEKQFYPFEELSILENMIKENKIDHHVDGIIFTPKYKKIGTNTQFDLLKWKPRHLHTFDFKINISDEGVTAFVNKNGVHVPYARASKNTEEERIFLSLLKTNCPDFINGSIVECSYDDVNVLYKPIKIRHDKIHPNSLYTIEKTLTNIRENITIEELIHLK